MKLFHFTSEKHLDYILGLGQLLTTESNIGAPDTAESRRLRLNPMGANVGPGVVWLTDDAQPKSSGITSGPGRKGTICVCVDVPDREVHHWPSWARAQGIDERWYEALARRHRPDTWWVVERNIPWSEWLSIDRVLPTRSSDRRRALREPTPAGLPWSPDDGITIRYTESEVREEVLTLLDDLRDGTFMVRNMAGEVFRIRP